MDQLSKLGPAKFGFAGAIFKGLTVPGIIPG
jgi:hypothetical protein